MKTLDRFDWSDRRGRRVLEKEREDARIKAMVAKSKATVKGRLLTRKQAVFVRELLASNSVSSAAIAAGSSPKSASAMGAQWLKHPKVAAALEKERSLLLLRARKSADDIVEYLQIAMYFVPSRYFQPGGRGGWMIDEDNYRNLPDEIGRLIEEVETRHRRVTLPDGTEIDRLHFWVKFVSKTKVTAMMSKYLLGVRHTLVPDQSWFDGMMKRSEQTEADVIENKIQQRLPVPVSSVEVKPNGEQSLSGS